MGQPLAVAGADIGAGVSTDNVGVVRIEARIPDPLTAGGLAEYVHLVGGIPTEAGRADLGAIGAREAAFSHLGPVFRLEIARSATGQVAGIHCADH